MKSNLSPIQRYALDIEEGKVFSDSAQYKAIKELETVYNNLKGRWYADTGIWHSFLKTVVSRQAEPVHGLYLWGGVGRGKTYLMDLFYHCLPSERKLRMHFHRFMQMVHRQLNEQKGRKNPLQLVAKNIASEVDVICFDEFFVADIGDAMILANILQTLFEAGVTLIATSNIVPADLYENGLQRERFLPAIALLESYTKVINVDGGLDYRLRSLEQAEIYHSPLGKEADEIMTLCFQNLASGQEIKQNLVWDVLGRDIRVKYYAEGMIWLDFFEICGGPRSAADYIEIAQVFHTVMISNIPEMKSNSDDYARRFISMVDEFYDHGVKLIISAAVPLIQLYKGDNLRFPFERTQSRLLEMQSHEYLARKHTP